MKLRKTQSIKSLADRIFDAAVERAEVLDFFEGHQSEGEMIFAQALSDLASILAGFAVADQVSIARARGQLLVLIGE